MYTLGINSAFHDSSACLVHNGTVIAAVEEERFTRVKHGKRPIPFSAYELPFHAIHYSLEEADLTLNEIDHIAYSFDPYIKLGSRQQLNVLVPIQNTSCDSPEWESPWDPLFLSYIAQAPQYLTDGVPLHLRGRFTSGELGNDSKNRYRWHFVPHHLAHAASAFHPSPFERACVLTIDGRGEEVTTSYWLGEGHQLSSLGSVLMPHSLGLLYEDLTRHLGFLHSSDEYKVMALASFGKPEYVQDLRTIIQYQGNGQFKINDMNWPARFGSPRRPGSPFEKAHYDLAHSIQVVLEETVLQIADWLHEETRLSTLAVAGGVGLNCVLNSRLRNRGPFEQVWVQPAAGDAGTSLGAALWIDGQVRHFPKRRCYAMKNVFLGPAYDDSTIKLDLERFKIPYRRLTNIAEETAELLANGFIVGWFQGRMEYGPRALGSRSILGSPLSKTMQERLNELKDREDFRPGAPVVLEESAADWFDEMQPSPFMLFVFNVLPHKAHLIPAVCHVDGTARIQTVRRDNQAMYYELLRAFERRTGIPILVNTSFNTRGEPIVCTPSDAIRTFWTSPLDALVIGSFLVQKREATQQC